MSILLYGCTTWTLTKRMEKSLDGNYTRMLQTILNKSRRQHPTKQQLYGHLTLITKTIKIRRTRHAGHCWRSKDELISDLLLLIPSHGRANAGQPTRTYKQQLFTNTGCSFWRLVGSNGRLGGVVREGQRYPCWLRNMMMMMIFTQIIVNSILYIFISSKNYETIINFN